MKKIILMVIFLFVSVVQAADYQKGLEAAQKGDFETVYKEWLPLAEQGDVRAQYNIGIMFENGRGVTKNIKKAFLWYEKAANQGHEYAQNNLGNMYYDGVGVKQDIKQAFFWYHKSASQGYAYAQYNLGDMYDRGIGVIEDDKLSIQWYSRSAEQGFANAQYNLGVMYDKKEKHKQAFYWYSKAAAQGFANAQYNLGIMYAYGVTVPLDVNKAYMWLNLAKYNGNNSDQMIEELISAMSKEEVAAAYKMSKICLESNYKNCG